jgi:hypothetical protein
MGYGGTRENTKGEAKDAMDSTINMIEVIKRRKGDGIIPILWRLLNWR